MIIQDGLIDVAHTFGRDVLSYRGPTRIPVRVETRISNRESFNQYHLLINDILRSFDPFDSIILVSNPVSQRESPIENPAIEDIAVSSHQSRARKGWPRVRVIRLYRTGSSMSHIHSAVTYYLTGVQPEYRYE